MTTTAELAVPSHTRDDLPDRLLTGSGSDLARHDRRYGPHPGARPDLIATIASAGLTGRGGAAFPVARKLATADASRGRRAPVVIANGAEGEPLSRKDAVLLTQSPHLVLDGIAAIADAVGADTAHLCVPASLVAHLDTAIGQRMHRDRVTVRIVTTTGRFVDGETTALVDRISGGRGVPRDRTVPTAVEGLDGRPTVVHNVETLAHVALIARNGPAWFRGRGTADEPGTALVTLSGRSGIDGVVETDVGTPLAVLLRRVDVDPSRLRAVLIGGFHGTWVDGRMVGRLAMSARSLSAVGATPGAGVVRYLMDGESGLAVVADAVGFLAQQSAGQCGPCRFGLPALAAAMDDLVAHGGEHRAHRVATLADTVDGRGACRHPDGTAHMVRSALRVFSDEVGGLGKLGELGGRRR